MKQMRRSPDFFIDKIRCMQGLSNKMRRRPDFLTEFWLVFCEIDVNEWIS